MPQRLYSRPPLPHNVQYHAAIASVLAATTQVPSELDPIVVIYTAILIALLFAVRLYRRLILSFDYPCRRYSNFISRKLLQSVRHVVECRRMPH